MSVTRTRSLAAACFAIFLVEMAVAKPVFVKPLKKLGYPVENCQYCHLERSPEKEKPHDVNSRGRWLWSEKQRRGVRTIDPGWLKDYPGDKEPK